MTATEDIGSQHHMGQDAVAVACLVLQQSPLIGRAGWPVKTALLGTRQGIACLGWSLRIRPVTYYTYSA
jgi:hypothetical protein